MTRRLLQRIATFYALAKRSLLRQPTVILFERSAEEAFGLRRDGSAAR